jgi:predicted O-methyltransferase YrrM
MDRESVIRQCYQVPGQTWPVELGWLYDTISHSKSHAEIGTFCGRSLLASCAGMTPGSFVLSVDDQSEWVNPTWVMNVQAATVAMLQQSVRTVNAHSIDALRTAVDAGLTFDSVFIDGCHEYAECKADIEGWQTRLNPGGLICGHDYWPEHIGVMNAVNEVFEGRHSVVPGTRIWFHRKAPS